MEKKKIIGFTASSFDLLHSGHILMLQEAKSNCDYLIVGFNTNPENKKPFQSVFERYTQLAAVKYVDEIIPYGSEEDLINILKSKNINVRFLGDDYRNKDFTGKDIERIKIHFNSRKHNYSSSGLIKRIRNEK